MIRPVAAETIYARHRVEALVGTSGLFLIALAAHSHGSNAFAISLAVVAVLLAAFVLRRPRLQVDSDGLVVVNLLRTYRIPWRDVSGFGFGTTGATPCLTIRRTEGTVVGAAVVNDNYRSGYSQVQLDAIVADLQERLAAANGTSVSRELARPVPGSVEPRARRASRRVTIGVWSVCCLFLLIFGIVTAWQAAAGLPRTYSRLDTHGVHATATFAGCRVTGVRHHECRLMLVFGGRTRTWTYPEDYPQFNGLAVGAAVDVLVDPNHSATVYTEHDVAIRYDAGFGALAIVGIAFAVAGFLGLAFLLWLQHLAAVARSRFSGNA
jgi:Bacterial PH domain